MSRIRHWKERWDPKADMVFNRYLTVMGVEVKPGDPVSAELRAKLGPHRLKIWWTAGTVRLATFVPNPKPAAKKPAPKPQLEVGIYPKKKDQWLVVAPNGVKRLVKGEEAAKALLAELSKPPEPLPPAEAPEQPQA